ncbi:MAG: response regulator transcription factor [Chloroflexota bacterium]|nr:response regulator transcription factor [Chloroflexota bacterium]
MTTGPDEARPLRVIVTDDWYIVREGARSALSSIEGIEVVATAGDAEELMGIIEEAEPDAVLLDIRMPPTHRTEGIDAAHEIRRRWPRLGVVILSQFDDPEYALELLKDGSNGRAYLLKERLGNPAQLAEALREVAAGGSILDPKVVDGLLEAQRRRSRSRLHGLTEREHEVLAMMAGGRTNAAIARTLSLTERAVEKHINSIFRKLGLSEELDTNHRVAAVLFFLQRQTA